MTKKMKFNMMEDNQGVAPLMETLISIGIAIALLIVFVSSVNTLYNVKDNPHDDLSAKCTTITEALLSFPGNSDNLNSVWETDPSSVSIVGLSTSRTIEYGVLYKQPATGEITILNKTKLQNNTVGVEKTCFLAGTRVVMADGSYKNIEDIKIGDMVKSYDEQTGMVVNRRVTNVFHHTPDEMTDYYIVVNGFIKVTPNHRLYSNNKWVYADELRVGDSLFSPQLNYKIFSIEKVFEKAPTYDLEVDVNHCYFIVMDNNHILSHNNGFGSSPPSNNPNNPPDAEPGGPYSGKIGETITFDCSGSDGCDKWRWDWEDDGIWDTPWISHTVNYTYDYGGYSEAKIYTARLEVINTTSFTDSETTTVTIVYNLPPVADFLWWDRDSFGSGTVVCLYAAGSIDPDGDIVSYKWYLDGSKTSFDQGIYVEKNLGDSSVHVIELNVTDDNGDWDTSTQLVQMNTVIPPDTSWEPWVLTSKDPYPENSNKTFTAYDTDYFVQYQNLSDPNYYLYEVKEKTNPGYILDYWKIINLSKSSYDTIKKGLGFDTSTYELYHFYDFNITFNFSVSGGYDFSFGPSFKNAEVLSSTVVNDRLVYHKPEAKKIGGGWQLEKPYYEKVKITIRVFY